MPHQSYDHTCKTLSSKASQTSHEAVWSRSHYETRFQAPAFAYCS